MWQNLLITFGKKAVYGLVAAGAGMALTALANYHPSNIVAAAGVAILTGLCAAIVRAVTYDPAKDPNATPAAKSAFTKAHQ